VVYVTGEMDDEWAAVTYEEKEGYMMRKFLDPLEELGEDNGPEDTEITAKIKQAQELLDEVILLLGGAVG